jgi:hypothetical protein
VTATLTDPEMIAAAREIDAGRSTIILACGKKGRGKSEAIRQVFDAWPFNRAIIDVTGDARPDDPTTVAIGMPAPVDLNHYRNRADDNGRLTLWVRVTPQQPERDFVQQQDDAVRLGLYPQDDPFLLIVDEYGRMVPNGRAGPNMSLALESSRHYNLSLGLACPRPRLIGQITIMQADLVLIYELPNFDDREFIAKNIGFPVHLFERAYALNQRRGPHAHLMWDARQSRLFDCGPLPIARSHGGRS